MVKDGTNKSLERYQAYENENIEKVILHLKRDQLKAGQYADLLKVKKGGEKK